MRTVVLDIETDSLNPTVVWVAVTKDVTTGEVNVFRRPDLDPTSLVQYLAGCSVAVGHNIIGFDWPNLVRLVYRELEYPRLRLVDTLVISRLLDFGLNGGHSLDAWGQRLGCRKTAFSDFSELTDEMVSYCIQDVEVTARLYRHFSPYLNSDRWKAPIQLEHYTAGALHEMKTNGFAFDVDKAVELRYNITEELGKLDGEISTAFPPRCRFVKEYTPRATKFGTISRSSVPRGLDDLTPYSVGSPFSTVAWEDFNPGSPAQIVERLNEAGWKPTEKTKTHVQAERDQDEEKLARLRITGWKVSETNLKTLPDTAPEAARKLAKRITMASRQRSLTEWINSTGPDNRIHGTVNHIGAWTQRCSHNDPNTANIPTPQPLNPNSTELQIWANEIDHRLRSLWTVSPGHVLVGVDAESIQLRVLAHYINDPRFTASLLTGKKEDGTDPHSLNKIALGDPCKSRNDAKTFIYAWLLGAGVGKVAEILGCSLREAKRAVTDFIGFYPGLKYVKEHVIPVDAGRGYFEGFDGRYVKIYGDDEGSRRHFALAGYLQGGEALIMKRGIQIWKPRLEKERVPFKLVNFVHDEYQTECPTYDTALYVAQAQADAIRQAGEDFNLRCPMAGSILGANGKPAIGQNWYETH